MNNQLDKALVLMRRVMLAMAICPEELQIGVEQFAGSVEITVTGNPADTKRLVGKGGANLKNLSFLFRLLSRGSGKHVGFAHLIPNDNPEHKFEVCTKEQKWNGEPVEALLRDIAEAVFECPVKITTTGQTGHSLKMYAIVQGDFEDSQVLGRFDKIINVLFVPIGTKHGMRVYAHATDWKAAAKVTHG